LSLHFDYCVVDLMLWSYESNEFLISLCVCVCVCVCIW
jgi:hypothetical protein